MEQNISPNNFMFADYFISYDIILMLFVKLENIIKMRNALILNISWILKR